MGAFRRTFHAKAALFAAAVITFATVSLSAPLSFVPQRLFQPDGRILECFATGDEYYNWLHDENGFTIVQDHSNGFYVYAVLVKGELVPSPYVAGRSDPVALGLQPWLNISPEAMAARREELLAAFPEDLVQGPAAGALNNIAVFIRFSDETEWTDAITKYETMFNASTPSSNSMYNYFMEASYGAVAVTTTMYPQPPVGNTTVVSYQDSHPRGYYQPYDSTTNPIGYKSDRAAREHTMLAAALRSIRPQIPPGMDLDSDRDNYVDNVCFVVKGTPTAWSTLLWPHAWNLTSDTVSLNGKRVSDYNLQLQSMMTAGVLVHEMYHTLGAPDLYRYNNKQIDPVSSWDIMATNVSTPMHMGAHMKFRYGGWIASIPAISAPGRYILKPLGTSATGNAYKILSPFSTSEYFVVEYRKKNNQTSIFERSLPGEGLLVTRINTARRGNASGPPDEIYVYRPGGFLTVNGTPSSAAFSAETGRDTISDETDPWPFLSTGRAGGLTITEVSARGDTIAFTLGKPVSAAIDSLKAVKQGDSVVVTFKTRLQYNLKSLEIQRANADTGFYGTISGSQMSGKGRSDTSAYYRWVDRGNSGEMWYRVAKTDSGSVTTYSRPAKLIVPVAVAAEEVPAGYMLSQNYPNPFNPTTTINFSVDRNVRASLRVYDILGRQVTTLFDGVAEAGHPYRLTFEGKGFASGVYHYVLQSEGRRDVRRMILLR